MVNRYLNVISKDADMIGMSFADRERIFELLKTFKIIKNSNDHIGSSRREFHDLDEIRRSEKISSIRREISWSRENVQSFCDRDALSRSSEIDMIMIELLIELFVNWLEELD